MPLSNSIFYPPLTSLVVGDFTGGDYTTWDTAGHQAMAGGARVYREKALTISYGRIQITTRPTLVDRGVFQGYSLPIYNSDDEEVFTCSCMPGDWDGVTDPHIYVGGWLSTANTNKKFRLQISVETADYANNAVVPNTTNDYPLEITTGTWAQYTSYKSFITVDASAIGLAAGQPLAVRVRRIAASSAEISGEVVLEGIFLRYLADKIGTAT